MDFFKDKKLRKHLFQSFGELLFLGIGGILLGVFLLMRSSMSHMLLHQQE